MCQKMVSMGGNSIFPCIRPPSVKCAYADGPDGSILNKGNGLRNAAHHMASYVSRQGNPNPVL